MVLINIITGLWLFLFSVIAGAVLADDEYGGASTWSGLNKWMLKSFGGKRLMYRVFFFMDGHNFANK
jgi:hypothetical protein